jgi:mono/diheme cytochrome c family protein
MELSRMTHLSRTHGIAVVFCFAAGVSSSLSAAASDDAGKTAFLAQKCNRCHSIEAHQIAATVKSETMRGPDLSTVGKKHDAAWIKQYVRKEVKLEDKDHKAKWEGSEEDLQRIADWLASLK